MLKSSLTPLRALRRKRRLTLVRVAKGVKTDPTNLSRIERGMQKSPELAEKLVKYFGRKALTEEQVLYPERFPVVEKRAA